MAGWGGGGDWGDCRVFGGSGWVSDSEAVHPPCVIQCPETPIFMNIRGTKAQHSLLSGAAQKQRRHLLNGHKWQNWEPHKTGARQHVHMGCGGINRLKRISLAPASF